VEIHIFNLLLCLLWLEQLAVGRCLPTSAHHFLGEQETPVVVTGMAVVVLLDIVGMVVMALPRLELRGQMVLGGLVEVVGSTVPM
jgi:hypothetical protein